MPRRLTLLILILTLLDVAAGGQTAFPADALRKSADLITPESLEVSLRYLASDEMRGRDTPSPELDRAAEWLAKRCEKAGLKPAFDGAWFQGPRTGDLEQAQGALIWSDGNASLPRDRFVSAGLGATTLARVPLVYFKGPWSRRSDARASLVKGRVVVLEGPAADEEPRRFSRRLGIRIRGLAGEGARAVVVVTDQVLPPFPGLDIPVILLRTAELEGRLPQENGEVRDFALSLSIPESKMPLSRNVGALLPGSDKDLTGEIVVFSAHYDHIGVGRAREGDNIYNGADDDATGTAAVLAIGEALAALPTPPRRSTLFLFFYGEEKGLLGSRWYCNNPARPLRDHKAVFNLEMVGRPDDIEPRTAWVTGWRVSDFGSLIAEAGQAEGIRFYEHKRMSRMLFGASDNISFARLGVPAHSISAGSLHRDYHKPSDEVGKIDFKNMAAVVRGIFMAGYTMANGGKLPTWEPGSSYEKAHKELLGEAGK